MIVCIHAGWQKCWSLNYSTTDLTHCTVLLSPYNAGCKTLHFHLQFTSLQRWRWEGGGGGRLSSRDNMQTKSVQDLKNVSYCVCIQSMFRIWMSLHQRYRIRRWRHLGSFSKLTPPSTSTTWLLISTVCTDLTTNYGITQPWCTLLVDVTWAPNGENAF